MNTKKKNFNLSARINLSFILLFFFSGVRIIIDKKAQLTLLGTEMDFVETKLASEFIFNNPNIKGTCGCGESFSI